jgi:hypothetical protein
MEVSTLREYDIWNNHYCTFQQYSIPPHKCESSQLIDPGPEIVNSTIRPRSSFNYWNYYRELPAYFYELSYTKNFYQIVDPTFCARDIGGKPYCWGANAFGQAGSAGNLLAYGKKYINDGARYNDNNGITIGEGSCIAHVDCKKYEKNECIMATCQVNPSNDLGANPSRSWCNLKKTNINIGLFG